MLIEQYDPRSRLTNLTQSITAAYTMSRNNMR